MPAPATSYSAILRIRGTAAFFAAGWFGRFPRACMSLGVVLLVSGASGSFALAGAVAAAFVFGMIFGGPGWSAAMDRWGQRRAIGASLVALLVTSVLLVVVVRVGLPVPLWFVAAVASGLSTADIGSAVRARWRVLADAADQHAAFALESVADESVFVFAPPIATALAASVNPAAGIAVALVTGLAGGLALVVQGGTQPVPVMPATGRSLRERLPPIGVLPVTLGCVSIGVMFGAYDITSVGWASERGVPVLAGVAIGVFGGASALGALIYGAIRWRASLVRRYVIAGFALAVVIWLLPLAASSLALLPATLLVGLVLSPVLIGGFAIAESRAPAGRATEALAYPAAGLSIGVTVGATWAGAILDDGGATGAFAVAAGAGIAAVLVAGVAELGLRALKRA